MSGKGNYITPSNAIYVCESLSVSSLGLASPPSIFRTTISEVTDTSIPLTATQCSPGSIVYATAGGTNDLVLPLGTEMEALFGGLQAGHSWMCFVTNESGGTWSITASTGHTVAGTGLDITNGSNVILFIRKTSANNYVTRPLIKVNTEA